MTDHRSIASFPLPAFKSLQASSYDRKSTVRNGPGWDANNDWNQFIRTDTTSGRIENVMLETTHPGALVRMWCGGAEPMTGTLRVYFDGSATPAITMPIDSFFVYGLAGKPLSEITARGKNNALPMPYARGCKITCEKAANINFWYNINYREYPDSTTVKTFSLQDLNTYQTEISKANQTLKNPASSIPAATTSHGMQNKLLTPSSGPITLDIPGPGAVCKMVIKLQSPNMQDALRSTRLRIFFDNRITVSDVPVGDFFASGLGLNVTSGWYSEVAANGTLTCYWIMPFKNAFRLELSYRGVGQVTASIEELLTCPWTWNTDRSMYFHSRWKEELNIPVIGANAVEWNYLFLRNRKGVYAGDVLTINNRNTGWWGEGDEKIFVDKETFPSTFGTGSEDYFGYAWGQPDAFTSPFHGQPLAAGNNAIGHTVNWGTRSLDGIPFNNTLDFNLEILDWSTGDIDFAVNNFWYAMPDTDSYFEGEDLEAKNTGGKLQVQRNWSFPWSAGAQRWWMDGTTGDTLSLDIMVPENGTYSLAGKFTQAVDYGIFDLYLDSVALKKDFDCYSPTVQFTPEVPLGEKTLTAGLHYFKAVIKGSNASAVKKYMFGLDYLVFKKLPTPVSLRNTERISLNRIDRIIGNSIELNVAGMGSIQNIEVLDAQGQIIPSNWNVTSKGICKVEFGKIPIGIRIVRVQSSGKIHRYTFMNMR